MSYAVSLSDAVAIENRTDLIEVIRREADRDDLTDDEAKEFIQRAEALFNRILRVPAMESVATITLVDGVGDLPDDWLASLSLFDADGNAIPAVSLVQLYEMQAYNRPVHRVVGNELRVKPDSDDTVTLVYYAKVPALTDAYPSNWLLDSHPDIYLYACLLMFASRVGDDDNIVKWKAALDEALGQLQTAGLRDRHAGPLLMRGALYQVRGATV